jgi:ClpP class serine protease
MMNTGEMVTDVGSVLSGEKAVSTGLIDAVGTLSEVLEELYRLIET